MEVNVENTATWRLWRRRSAGEGGDFLGRYSCLFVNVYQLKGEREDTHGIGIVGADDQPSPLLAPSPPP